jgi:hypothetical protein
MRLGYYKLYRPKIKASDWIWIIDHSVQTGPEKCLVILGVRQSDLPEGRPLTYKDVEPIELIPVVKSNGEIVYEQLGAAVSKTGVPREIVGDHGSDIKLGIEKFCNEHEDTVYVYDVKHKMAALLKNKLSNNEQWQNFTKLCAQTKQQVQQTKIAELSPPQQRSKARYMNTEHLLNWSKQMLIFLSQSKDEMIARGYDAKIINDKFGWLVNFSSDLEQWSLMLHIVTITENFVRNNGFYNGADNDLQKEFTEHEELCQVLPQPVQDIKDEILEYMQAGSNKANSTERLLGSSEIIESVFGKQKHIEKEQSKFGFTGLLLTIGSIVSQTTTSIVKQALETVTTKNVHDWYKKHIGKSLQRKRIDAFKTPMVAE